MYAGLVLIWWFVHTDKPFNDLFFYKTNELPKEKTDQEKKAYETFWPTIFFNGVFLPINSVSRNIRW